MTIGASGAVAALRRPSLQTLRLSKNRSCNRCNLSTGVSQPGRQLSRNPRIYSTGEQSASQRPPSPRIKSDRLASDKGDRQSTRQRANPTQHKTANRQPRPPARPSFIISPNARSHYQSDGTFKTTPENYEWFRQTGIVPDNNDKWYMQGLDKAHARQLAFHATFSRKHYIDPIHAEYFAPHVEPRVVALRAEYERKLSKPLWVYAGCYTEDRVVVRTIAKRKLVGYMYEAKKLLLKEGIHVRGTVHFSIWSPTKILMLEKGDLLKRIVDALRHEASQQPQPEQSDIGVGAGIALEDGEPVAENIVAASRNKAARHISSTQQDSTRKGIKPDRVPKPAKEEPEAGPLERVLKAEQNRQRTQVQRWTDEAKAATASRGLRNASTKNTEALPSSRGHSSH